MVRVFVAISQSDERSAFCNLLLDRKMEIVGEAADWTTTLEKAPATHFNMLLVGSELLPLKPGQHMEELRQICPYEFTIILISHLDARQYAALSVGADDFITRSEVPKRLIERIQAAAKNLQRGERRDQTSTKS